jgi:MoxR-like ATPase
MLTIMQVAEASARLKENVGRVIVGKDDVIELLLVALFCDGHVLLEDVPGIGKTMLAKTLARSLGCTFSRIQFTPDLLPSDITGVNVFNQRTGDFEYRGGPILAEVVLADEINRAGPRTQSALLEAMEERQVTVDGVTRPLAYPFLVLATQNPVELEGTFPLPEAQLDRFLLRVAIGYPGREDERTILRRFRTSNPLTEVQPLIGATELRTLSERCRQVACHPVVEDYLLDLVHASRNDPTVELGVSPRGTLAFLRAGQALAAIRGRDFVTPDDLQVLARSVLAHRLILSPESRLRGHSPDDVVKRLIDQTPAPVEERWSARQ